MSNNKIYHNLQARCKSQRKLGNVKELRLPIRRSFINRSLFPCSSRSFSIHFASALDQTSYTIEGLIIINTAFGYVSFEGVRVYFDVCVRVGNSVRLPSRAHTARGVSRTRFGARGRANVTALENKVITKTSQLILRWQRRIFAWDISACYLVEFLFCLNWMRANGIAAGYVTPVDEKQLCLKVKSKFFRQI